MNEPDDVGIINPRMLMSDLLTTHRKLRFIRNQTSFFFNGVFVDESELNDYDTDTSIPNLHSLIQDNLELVEKIYQMIDTLNPKEEKPETKPIH